MIQSNNKNGEKKIKNEEESLITYSQTILNNYSLYSPETTNEVMIIEISKNYPLWR